MLDILEHVTHSDQRTEGRLRGLYRFISLLPESVKLHLMKSLVLSVFYSFRPDDESIISNGDTQTIHKAQTTSLCLVIYINTIRVHHHLSKRVKLPDSQGVCAWETLVPSTFARGYCFVAWSPGTAHGRHPSKTAPFRRVRLELERIRSY